MSISRRLLYCVAPACVAVLLAVPAPPARAYVEAPHSLGQVISLSTNIMVLQVEKVDKEKNMIIYKKLYDLKGKHPTDVIKHNIGRGGFHPREWQYPMEWVEVGKKAVFFHNGGASETCIGTYWYQCYAQGEWWGMSHGEPFLLRTFAGDVNKLAAAVKDILDNKEVIVPCMVDGNKDDLHLRRAKIQRLRASLSWPLTTRSATSSAGAARTSAAWAGCPPSRTTPPSTASIPTPRPSPARTWTATASRTSAWSAPARWP